jgi:hypothetical protein
MKGAQEALAPNNTVGRTGLTVKMKIGVPRHNASRYNLDDKLGGNLMGSRAAI